MKKIVLVSVGIALAAAALAGVNDWRNRGAEAQKLRQLIAVMPGTGEIMWQLGERYRNLYWAAKQGRWEFAAYQAEEMEELLEKLQIAQPKREKDTQAFLTAVYPSLSAAIETRDWKRFEPAFERLRGECMACHVRSEHAFITLTTPKSAASPVLNARTGNSLGAGPVTAR